MNVIPPSVVLAQPLTYERVAGGSARTAAARERFRYNPVTHGVRSTDQTVILAAGLRLSPGSAEAGVPKPLMAVAGVALIAHALVHAGASGCRDAVIVIGYEGDRVRAAVEAMHRTGLSGGPIRRNSVFRGAKWPLAPCGRTTAASPVLSANGRPCVCRPVLPILDLAGPTMASRGFVDRVPDESIDLDDATRVRLVVGHITASARASTLGTPSTPGVSC